MEWFLSAVLGYVLLLLVVGLLLYFHGLPRWLRARPERGPRTE